MSHVTTGIRKILESPTIYQSFQTLVGANRLYKRFVQEILKVQENDTILDIGCGTGELLKYFPNNISYKYIGIDLNEKYIEQARKRHKDKGTFFCGEISTTFQFDFEHKFDKIFAFALLHHLDDDIIDSMLQKVVKLLKPDGIFCTIDPTFAPNQSPIAKKIISMDRGQNVKSPENYTQTIEKVFNHVECEVLTNYINIPYNHCIIKAKL